MMVMNTFAATHLTITYNPTDRMTEEAKRLQKRLSRYEDEEINDDAIETIFPSRKRRTHCFITEPAVF